MIRFIIPFLFIVPSVLFAQKAEKESEALRVEREKILSLIDSLEQRLIEIDKQISTSSGEDRVQRMIDKYGKNKGKMIAAGKVWTSISTEMALDSWGEPVDKQKSELNNLTTERWIYPDNRFLYFENDRLISWKE